MTSATRVGLDPSDEVALTRAVGDTTGAVRARRCARHVHRYPTRRSRERLPRVVREEEPGWGGRRVRPVGVADPSSVARRGLVALLEDLGREVVAQVEDPRRVIDAAEGLRGALLVLDVSSESDPGGLVSSIVEQCEDCRILVITDDTRDATLIATLRAGAGGFVVKDTAEDVLPHALAAVEAGRTFIDPRIASVLVTMASKGERLPRAPFGLTAQQQRVVGLVRRGMTNRQIGDHLGISPDTVKAHLREAMVKLGAHDRIEAAEIADRSDIA